MTIPTADPDLAEDLHAKIDAQRRHAMGRRVKAFAWATGTMAFAFAVFGSIAVRMIM